MVDIGTDPRIGNDVHAIMFGGGMTGLLVARVLSEHFGRATMIERDRSPEGPKFRKGGQGCPNLRLQSPRPFTTGESDDPTDR